MDSFSTFSVKIEKLLIGEVSRIETKNQVTIECVCHQFKMSKKFYFGCNLINFLGCTIFGEKVMNKSMALVAVFGTNIEMSQHESK